MESGDARQGAREVHKVDTTRVQRLARLIWAIVDPRAWAHGLKVLNYYNYTHVRELRKARIGADVRISPTVSLANGENIEIGDRVRIGANCTLWAGPGTGRIVIGDDCLFAPNAMLTATNYRFNDGSPVTAQAMREGDVTLGRDVWLGYGAVVLPGTEIGDGAIIGAGAVVRGKIPAHAIVATKLATVIGKRGEGPFS